MNVIFHEIIIGQNYYYIQLKCIIVEVIMIFQRGIKMKIAVTYENEQIFQHFGHTKQFKIYEIENTEIVNSEIVDTNGQGHGALADFLQIHEVKALICGGIGGGAKMALAEKGITLYGGAHGNVDEAVKNLLTGKLIYNPNVQCNHHGHNHEEGNHTCGEHGCGTHNCR